MLQKLADHISICHDRAAVAERQAEEAREAGNPALKRHYEEIAKAWRHLATRCQFAELRLIVDLYRTKDAPPAAPP